MNPTPRPPSPSAMTRTLLSLALCVSSLALAAEPAKADEAIKKPLVGVIGSVRQSRDLAALKFFAIEDQGKYLCGDQWAKGTDAQHKEFQDGFLQLFGKIAFPKIRENFKNLDTILYEAAKAEGDRAEMASVILINHPLKKQELKLKYTVVKAGKDWKVLDVAVLGDSMLKGIRDDQVLPLLQEGGWPKLLDAMKTKNAELKDVVLK